MNSGIMGQEFVKAAVVKGMARILPFPFMKEKGQKIEHNYCAPSVLNDSPSHGPTLGK